MDIGFLLIPALISWISLNHLLEVKFNLDMWDEITPAVLFAGPLFIAARFFNILDINSSTAFRFLIFLPLLFLFQLGFSLHFARFIRKRPPFHKKDGLDLPPHDGDVRILASDELPEGALLLGSSYLEEKTTKEELLKKFKEEAGKHGADILVLVPSEPRVKRSGWLDWGALAYRSNGDE
jgi:hypothetical protein